MDYEESDWYINNSELIQNKFGQVEAPIALTQLYSLFAKEGQINPLTNPVLESLMRSVAGMPDSSLVDWVNYNKTKNSPEYFNGLLANVQSIRRICREHLGIPNQDEPQFKN